MTRRSMHGIVAHHASGLCLLCPRLHVARGLCWRCYMRRWRAGALPAVVRRSGQGRVEVRPRWRVRRIPDARLELALAAAEESGSVPAALVAWILAGGTRPAATCAPRRSARREAA